MPENLLYLVSMELILAFLRIVIHILRGERRTGVAPTKYIKQDIQSLKKDADFIVVSIHQGMDISEYPLESEVEQMHLNH